MPNSSPPRQRVVVPIEASPRAGERRHPAPATGSFPLAAGILFGLGLGGFLDGIVLHQILQWHHTLTSAGYPADSVRNLRINAFWDGIFEAATCVFFAAGLVVLWRAAQRRHASWSARLLAATMLMGFGAFNLAEGIVDHLLLGLHHVNETVPREQWLAWDLGFLAWGALMLLAGFALYRRGRARPDHDVPRTAWPRR